MRQSQRVKDTAAAKKEIAAKVAVKEKKSAKENTPAELHELLPEEARCQAVGELVPRYTLKGPAKGTGTIGVYLVGSGSFYVGMPGGVIPMHDDGFPLVDTKPNSRGYLRMKWLPNPLAAWEVARAIAGWVPMDQFCASHIRSGTLLE